MILFYTNWLARNEFIKFTFIIVFIKWKMKNYFFFSTKRYIISYSFSFEILLLKYRDYLFISRDYIY